LTYFALRNDLNVSVVYNSFSLPSNPKFCRCSK